MSNPAARKRLRRDSPEARRITHLAHVNMRLRTMYGLEVDGAQFDAMARAFRSGKVAASKPDHYGRVWGWVDVRGVLVCACYAPSAQCVTTVMPPPPPLPEAKPPAPPPPAACNHTPASIAASARAMADHIVAQALGDGAARKADVAWLKARFSDVKALLRSGDTFAAYLLCDSVASLHRSLAPSVGPQVTEARLRARVEEEVDELIAALSRFPTARGEGV